MRIVVFTGAGMSAESGISTFRDANGLWEGHNVMEVASPDGYRKNPELVLDFYNQRRRQLFEVEPNEGHLAIARMQDHFDVDVITQNVDDLHERAGSEKVLHLHGELRKVRSTADDGYVLPWLEDLHPHHVDPNGHPLRPHIVWFGEAVPAMDEAVHIASTADKLLVIGSSLQVYPAASLIGYVPDDCEVHYVDPRPHISYELSVRGNTHIWPESAAEAVPRIVDQWIKRKVNP